MPSLGVRKVGVGGKKKDRRTLLEIDGWWGG